jgi:hypothetical protein
VWLADVFAYNVTTPLFDLLLLAYDFDSSAARASCWFHNVHVFKLTDFSVNAPPFVIIWQNVSSWSNVEGFAVKTSHSLHILPHQVFASNAPAPCKVICVLKLVYILYSVCLKQACPQYIPRVSLADKMESGHFKGINNAVISMG